MLGEFAQTIIQGAATSIAVDKTRKAAEQAGQHEQPPRVRALETYADFLEQLEEQTRYLKIIADSLTVQGSEDIEKNLILEAYPRTNRITKAGRNHNMIFLPSAQSLYIVSPTLGIITTGAQKAGWILLDMPDGTEIGLPSGASTINALYRCSDQAIGSAISW